MIYLYKTLSKYDHTLIKKDGFKMKLQRYLNLHDPYLNNINIMDTNTKKQLEESIEIINKGNSAKVDDLILGRNRNKSNLKELTTLTVNGYLHYYDYNTISVKDIPKSIIKDELINVKDKFKLLMEKSKIFKEYAINKGIDYYLLLDYQNVGVVICCEEKGEYKEFI